MAVFYSFDKMFRAPKPARVEEIPGDNFDNTSKLAGTIFDDSDAGENEDVNEEVAPTPSVDTPMPEKKDKKEKKLPKTKFGMWMYDNKVWLILLLSALLIIVTLSLIIYFMKRRCDSTVIYTEEKFQKEMESVNEQIDNYIAERDRYCEEAQKLRNRVNELNTECEVLRRTNNPVIQNAQRIQNKHKKSQKKQRVERINDNDEAIHVELPIPSTQVSQPNMDNVVVTAEDEEFDEELIEM